jgi:hypothetical protein
MLRCTEEALQIKDQCIARLKWSEKDGEEEDATMSKDGRGWNFVALDITNQGNGHHNKCATPVK